MRRGGPPFIGEEEGGHKMRYLQMERAKLTPNRHTPHSFYHLTTETNYGKVVGGSLPKMEPNETGWDGQ
jgi:hypothetical protein